MLTIAVRTVRRVVAVVRGVIVLSTLCTRWPSSAAQRSVAISLAPETPSRIRYVCPDTDFHVPCFNVFWQLA